MKLSPLEQKILMNIQLGVICTDMVDFCMVTYTVKWNPYKLYNRSYRIWKNFGGRKFWQIITDEANGEENFGKSAGRSSVISLYL